MSDDEFISYDDSDSGVSYSPEPDHEDEDDYIGKGPFLYYFKGVFGLFQTTHLPL